MANSVSLSTDMSKLLFTDSSGTTEIPLSGHGAMIQINADGLFAEVADSALSGSGIIESTDNAQWTITFNTVEASAFFIGIDDVQTNITAKGHKFNLTGKKLNIRELGNNIIVILK